MFHVHVSGDLENQSAKLPADQLDLLVEPIALYPDPMLNQALMASTYRLEHSASAVAESEQEAERQGAR